MNSEELNNRLSNFKEIGPCGPISESAIAAAEQQLGFHFSPQYRSFLSAFGCGGIARKTL
jgi:hypothetical protein